ncbi:MmpS family protein [Mycolicibacterium sp. 120270]|uniref:MmpS family protein n=1 Tax=Mycolicibacterium sp. 120270 TaxID=3090600 RepID=UPI00299D1FFE|nr:MmpS family protein [Mycolicibacterium sp. 120270]MDX1883988.1 MmpS family protein [Mycolicibacterium sp. 120270]
MAPDVDAGEGFSIFSLLKRLWIPLLVLVVVGAGAFTVSRLHGVFGSDTRQAYADTSVNDSKPFDPKHLTYEVFGPAGTVATISYFDENSEPTSVEGAVLPWSLTFEITESSAMGSVMAQGDSGSIGCRILVDDEVKAENSSTQVNAFTSCLLKAA